MGTNDGPVKYHIIQYWDLWLPNRPIKPKVRKKHPIPSREFLRHNLACFQKFYLNPPQYPFCTHNLTIVDIHIFLCKIPSCPNLVKI